MPKNIQIFKLIFLIQTSYLILLYFYRHIVLADKTFEWTVTNTVVYGIAYVIQIIFLIRLYDAVNLLKLNNIVKYKPSVFVIAQIALTNRWVVPGLLIPIFVWVTSNKLLALVSIEAHAERKFLFLPKSKKTWNVLFFLSLVIMIVFFLGKMAGKGP